MSMSRLFITVAAVALLPALQGCEQKQAQELPPRPVLTMVVSPRIEVRNGFAGTVEPRYQSDLSFRVIGRVTDRPVKVGDQVRKGQILGSVDPTPLDLTVRAAKADLVSAKAQADNANADEARRRVLYGQRNVSAETFEQSQQTREAAQASLLRAQTSLDKAREQRSYADLTAEYDAVVTSVFVEVGQMASPGARAITIAQPDVRDAVIDVPDELAPAIHLGTRFRIELYTAAAAPAHGEVREVAPQIDPLTHTRRVKIAIKDPGPDFRLGTLVTAYVEGSAEAKMQIPSSAIVARDGKSFVWIVDPSALTVRTQEVALARRDEHSADVASGLEAGSRVVVAGANSLAPGQKVRLLEQETQ